MAHVVMGKGSARNTLWGMFKTYIVSESGFPVSGKGIFVDSAKEIRESAGRALDQLLVDILEREQNRDEAFTGRKVHMKERLQRQEELLRRMGEGNAVVEAHISAVQEAMVEELDRDRTA